MNRSLQLRPRHPRRILGAAGLVLALVVPLVAAGPAQAASKGQICAAAELGKTAKDAKSGAALSCAKDGSVNRWVSAPPTTKSTKPTATTKGSTGGSGAATAGQFCKAAEVGAKATDARGKKLVCKADAKGKARWTAA